MCVYVCGKVVEEMNVHKKVIDTQHRAGWVRSVEMASWEIKGGGPGGEGKKR